MIKLLLAENESPLSPTELGRLSELLGPQIFTHATKYRRWQDSQAHLLGRYLLGMGLEQFGFDRHILQEMEYTPHNRPFLPISLDFNISHSGGYVICALSPQLIGIDIEKIKSVEPDDFDTCFSKEQLQAIKESEDPSREFFTYWTIKESLIKADGRGMNIPLVDLPVDPIIILGEHTWHIHKVDIDPNYQCHLSTNENLKTELSLERINLAL